jgi:hypothetical protein
VSVRTDAQNRQKTEILSYGRKHAPSVSQDKTIFQEPSGFEPGFSIVWLLYEKPEKTESVNSLH